MTHMNLVIAVAMMAAAGLTSTWAQAQAAISEPGAYQAAHPDRDVLNGGQLTPWGREIRGEQYSGVNAAYAAERSAVMSAPTAHVRRKPHQQ